LYEYAFTLFPNGFGFSGCVVIVTTSLPCASSLLAMYLPIYPNAPVTTSMPVYLLIPVFTHRFSECSHPGIL
jgi:hypothetical protein